MASKPPPISTEVHNEAVLMRIGRIVSEEHDRLEQGKEHGELHVEVQFDEGRAARTGKVHTIREVDRADMQTTLRDEFSRLEKNRDFGELHITVQFDEGRSLRTSRVHTIRHIKIA